MKIAIEVVHALTQEQTIVRLQMEAGATVADALAASRIFEGRPGTDGATCKVGIWGQVVPRAHVLREGDRVEVYRPLIVDAKSARREKARNRRA
jgi:uncharacterized protein